MTILIRHYARRDLPEILRIERRSFEYPWDGSDFRYAQGQRHYWIVVADDSNAVAGYAVYACYEKSVEMLNVAVHPIARRSGIGSSLVRGVLDRLSRNKQRNRLLATVSDRNLCGHLFLRSCGLKATAIIQGPFDLCEEWDGQDGYRFEYRVPGSGGYVPQNRIAKYVR